MLPPRTGTAHRASRLTVARTSIYGAYNVENDTPQSYVANIDGFEGATYKRVTPQFYAVSGTSGADIYYER